MASAAIAPVSAEADRSDGALVEAHLDGDSVAFDALYRRHQQRLVRFCWKQTHDLPLAEDLAQEAMIRYLQKADTFDTSQPMWPWLKTIARNLVIDHYRRTSNDPHLDPDLGGVHDGSNACTVRLDRIEAQSELRSVLAGLPERQRVALRLHHEEDWTTADVANYLDIKVNACKQLLYRARKNARQGYEELVESTEASFSIVFAHPILLALRERFQRSRTTIEALATDVASMTIALEAISEKAIVALAVIAAAVTGSQVSLEPVPASHSVRTHFDVSTSGGAMFETAGADTVEPAVRTAPVPEAREARTADPGGNSVEFGTSTADLDAELPAASMSAAGEAETDDRISLTTRVWAYVPGFEDPPHVDGVVFAIHCEPGSITSDVACSGLDTLQEIVPPPTD